MSFQYEWQNENASTEVQSVPEDHGKKGKAEDTGTHTQDAGTGATWVWYIVTWCLRAWDD